VSERQRTQDGLQTTLTIKESIYEEIPMQCLRDGRGRARRPLPGRRERQHHRSRPKHELRPLPGL